MQDEESPELIGDSEARSPNNNHSKLFHFCVYEFHAVIQYKAGRVKHGFRNSLKIGSKNQKQIIRINCRNHRQLRRRIRC